MIDPHEIRRHERYGILYNWFAAQNVAFPPAGWKLPSFNDFDILRLYLDPSGSGNINSAGILLQAYILWFQAIQYTDQYRYSAIPGGYRHKDGSFYGNSASHEACFWTSTIYSGDIINNARIYPPYAALWLAANRDKWFGMYVRFIKNDSNLPSGNAIADADGNIYRVVKIGNQVWTAQNWNCTRFSQYPFTPITLIEDPAYWGETGVDPRRCYINNDKSLS